MGLRRSLAVWLLSHIIVGIFTLYAIVCIIIVGMPEAPGVCIAAQTPCLVLTYNYALSKHIKGSAYSGVGPHYPANIGDYIQSLAAMQFCPPQCRKCFVEREVIRYYDGVRGKMIANAWWRIHEGTEMISDRIVPLMVSIHIDNPANVTSTTLNFLRSKAPIGCRDTATANFLQSQGVPSYFSGCMTLTLGKSYHHRPAESPYIVFSDVNVPTLPEQLRQEVEKILEGYKGMKTVNVGHRPQVRDAEDGLKKADELLKIFERASLVLTNRLHCTLPCLSRRNPRKLEEFRDIIQTTPCQNFHQT